MTDRVLLPMEMLVAATPAAGEQDPLGHMHNFLVFCMRQAVTEPHNRRVLEVLFTKCEYTCEMDHVLERFRDAAHDGHERLERCLRDAIAQGHLPQNLDAARAADIVHAFLGGVLRDWLQGLGSIVLPRDAVYLADCCIGLLQHSPSLRNAGPTAALLKPPVQTGDMLDTCMRTSLTPDTQGNAAFRSSVATRW